MSLQTSHFTVSQSTGISSTTIISLGVFDWSASFVLPSQNTCVNNFIKVLSNIYTAPTSGTINKFKIEMIVSLALPLNTMDPSEVVSLCLASNNGIGNMPVNGDTYYFRLSMSQGGNEVSSPIFPLTINYLETTLTNSNGVKISIAFIPVGNFFNIVSPGVHYLLVIEAYLAAKS